MHGLFSISLPAWSRTARLSPADTQNAASPPFERTPRFLYHPQSRREIFLKFFQCFLHGVGGKLKPAVRIVDLDMPVYDLKTIIHHNSHPFFIYVPFEDGFSIANELSNKQDSSHLKQAQSGRKTVFFQKSNPAHGTFRTPGFRLFSSDFPPA